MFIKLHYARPNGAKDAPVMINIDKVIAYGPTNIGSFLQFECQLNNEDCTHVFESVDEITRLINNC